MITINTRGDHIVVWLPEDTATLTTPGWALNVQGYMIISTSLQTDERTTRVCSTKEEVLAQLNGILEAAL